MGVDDVLVAEGTEVEEAEEDELLLLLLLLLDGDEGIFGSDCDCEINEEFTTELKECKGSKEFDEELTAEAGLGELNGKLNDELSELGKLVFDAKFKKFVADELEFVVSCCALLLNEKNFFQMLKSIF